MHIPAEMMNGAICPITATVSVISIAGATIAAMRSKERPDAQQCAAVAACIFAMQMLNFPIQQGTSGHFMGGAFAAALLGTPYGILVMSVVLCIQTLLFGDGGLSVLGVNILNMAIIGAGISGLCMSMLRKYSVSKKMFRVYCGLIAWFSIVCAASACSLELAFSGSAQLMQVLPAMVSVHSVIGIGEALCTIGLLFLVRPVRVTPQSIGVPLSGIALSAVMLSPFASGFPDGLEWVAEHYVTMHEHAPLFVSPYTDYAITWIASPWMSTIAAGCIGLFVTSLIAYGLQKATVRY